MKILVIGAEGEWNECRSKFGPSHEYQWESLTSEGEKFFDLNDIIFDFTTPDDLHGLSHYHGHPKSVAFLNTVKISLAECIQLSDLRPQTVFGFCGLPTFLNRPLLEVSVYHEEDKILLKESCEKLETEFVVVDDRVGLVTPRVIAMIINEAYNTVQEGTATKNDVDQAMKLGTNYPYGPFDWCQKIGKRAIYELLGALYEDTKDERYKISALLKKEYLRETHSSSL